MKVCNDCMITSEDPFVNAMLLWFPKLEYDFGLVLCCMYFVVQPFASLSRLSRVSFASVGLLEKKILMDCFPQEFKPCIINRCKDHHQFNHLFSSLISQLFDNTFWLLFPSFLSWKRHYESIHEVHDTRCLVKLFSHHKLPVNIAVLEFLPALFYLTSLLSYYCRHLQQERSFVWM